MRKRTNILDVFFDAITIEGATNNVLNFLKGPGQYAVYTANPEFVMEAQKNKVFRDILNSGDLVVADGIGVVLGSKIIKKSLPERVAGYDLVQNIFSSIKSTPMTVYFFGAAPNIASIAASRMMEKHAGLKIIGTHNGYFDSAEEAKIIDEINNLKPDLLLIGLGAPRQEKWWTQHRDHLNVNVCICVGGSFDVMSGTVKRAPKLFIKLGLEWFHRLITQPSRFKRMMKLPLFLVQVFKTRKKYMT
ncbi:MAG: WecB/TagA/CpsF family glycosyltransferase [Vallitaleaceae bacterium]|nr:WecB/TagA/CpsF family glycosyltransferase [Vallitaleaceae bacterium]